MGDSNTVVDPCGEFTVVQRNAIIWFVCAVFGGAILVTQFARIDRHMYDTNAETLDYGKYRENRSAQQSMASERVDPRAQGKMPLRAGSFE